jgi:hypothetical protein
LEAEAVRIAEQRREESHPLVKVIDQHGRVIVKQLAAINRQMVETDKVIKKLEWNVGCLLSIISAVIILSFFLGLLSMFPSYSSYPR